MLLVCGLGRCGSSMVMRMLEAVGYAVPGEHPYFEPSREEVDGPNWMDKYDAVKWLNPARMHPIKGDFRTIWLMRDPIEQAQSWVKFARFHNQPMPEDDDAALNHVLKHIFNQTIVGLDVVARSSTGPVNVMWYDHMVEDPYEGARKLLFTDCSQVDVELIQKAAGTVTDRSPKCLEELIEGEHPHAQTLSS